MDDEILNYLLIAVVQSQDADNAENAIHRHGITSNRLPSVGGFLGRRNATLLVGLSKNKVDQALELINANCRQRVEYIAVPLESAPLPLPTPTPITIGGATVFGLELDHYEEI